MNFSNLKEGNVLSETQYYTVVKKSGNKIQLRTDNGENVVLTDSYVNSGLLNSASDFSKEQKVNKTEAANIFLANPATAMTVNYQKQVKEADVIKEMLEAIDGAKIKDIESAIKKGVKKSITGEERTIVGRHFGEKDEFGRVRFVDMEIDREGTGYDNRIRLVDPRTINFLIVKDIRYFVK